MKNPPMLQQQAIALTVQTVLNRRPVYMIVCHDKHAKLVMLDIDPQDDWLDCSTLNSKIDLTPSDYVWSTKKDAEKALTFARKKITEELAGKIPTCFNQRSLTSLMILKVSVSIAPAMPMPRVRKSPGGGQDHSTLANPYGRPWPFSAAGPERAELEARLKKTKNPEMRAKLQSQLAAFATDEETK